LPHEFLPNTHRKIAHASFPLDSASHVFSEQVPLEATIINDIATPASGKYLVAATNNNIVLTLKG
jgi:hypothetical protein